MALPIIYSIIAVCFRTREYLLSGFMELKRYHQMKRGHTLLAQPRGVGGIVGCSHPGCSLIELQVAPRSACSQLEQRCLCVDSLGSSVTSLGLMLHVFCPRSPPYCAWWPCPPLLQSPAAGHLTAPGTALLQDLQAD